MSAPEEADCLVRVELRHSRKAFDVLGECLSARIPIRTGYRITAARRAQAESVCTHRTTALSL
jgi:hypothetical protein